MSKVIGLRISDEEYNLLQATARQRSCSVAELFRKAMPHVFQPAVRQQQVTMEMFEELKETVEMLANWKDDIDRQRFG